MMEVVKESISFGAVFLKWKMTMEIQNIIIFLSYNIFWLFCMDLLLATRLKTKDWFFAQEIIVLLLIKFDCNFDI